MSEWRIEYKCRRCGEICEGSQGAEQNCCNAVSEACIAGFSRRSGVAVTIIMTHTCKDNGYGVMDLIGCAETKKES